MLAVDELALRLLRVASIKGEMEALAAAATVRRQFYGPVWSYVMAKARFTQFNGGTVCHVAAASNLWQLFQFFSETGANPLVRDNQQRLPSETAAEAGHVCTAVHIRCVYEAEANARPRFIALH